MKNKLFTLIELLVVIGIIAILTAILLPVINGAVQKAEMSKCKAEMTTLFNAIKQYESTYGVLPVPKTRKNEDGNVFLDSNEYTWLIRLLQGENIDGSIGTSYGTSAVCNPRNIKFLDVVANNPGEYQDPWENDYKVHFDSNYDGKIKVPSPEPSHTEDWAHYIHGLSDSSTLNYSVVIWSKGPDERSDSDNVGHKTNKDNIYSMSTIWSNTGHNISK